MNLTEYQEKAKRTKPDPEIIYMRMWESRQLFVQLDQASHGLSDEVGEIGSAIEKWMYYGQELDTLNLKEEIGDCLWYLAQMANALGMKLEDIASSNIKKLETRYPDRFTTEDSKEENRDREKEAQVVGESNE